MKLILLIFPLTAFLLASCTNGDKSETPTASDAKVEQQSDSAKSDASKSTSSLSNKAGQAMSAASVGGASAEAMSTVKKVSGFSDTVNSTWNSIKGLDFAEKAQFVKKSMGMLSSAKDQIAMLQKLASSLPEGLQSKILEQVGGLTGVADNLGGLLGKAGSITSGDWSSYKDQIGSAMGMLGGKFAGLDSLL